MQREEFISKLERLLRGMPEAERKDILYDYEEHIRIAVENGLEEEKVIDSLGSPQSIAKQYRVKRYIDKAEASGSTTSVFRAILATVGLGFFNLIFILGPFMAVVGILIAIGVSAVAVVIGGAGLILGGMFPQIISGVNVELLAAEIHGNMTAGMLFGGVGTMCLGALMGLGTVALTKGFMTMTIKYLKLNINIIRGTKG